MNTWKKNSLTSEPLYGEKKNRMFQRPLVPLFIAFAGGILLGHFQSLACEHSVIPILLGFSFLATIILLIPQSLKAPCLIIIFLLAGALIDQGTHRPSKILSYATQREKVTIEGTVLVPPRITEKRARLNVRAHCLFVKGRRIFTDEKIFVSVYNHPAYVRPGEKIRFPARLRPFKNFNNPGRYDYESAMRLKGFSCAAAVSDGRYIVPMGPGYLTFIQRITEMLQGPVRAFFENELSPRDNAIFRALILGERQEITDQLREPFNRTGLGHLLAVSGLHIGLVAWISFFLFKAILSRSYKLSLKTDIRKICALMTCLPVLGYALIAGFQVSSLRAMIMVLVFLLSVILKREKDRWSTLALAGLIILAADPHAIFSISFQLSFIAVGGILWLTPPIMTRFAANINLSQNKKTGMLQHALFYIVGLAAASLAATIILLPILSLYFHRISLVTLPANIMTVPILGLWILPMGMLSCLVLPLSHQLACIFIHLGTLGLHIMMEIIGFWSSIPWSSIMMVTPNIYEIFIYYALIFFIFFIRRFYWAKRGFAAVILIVFIDIACWTYKVHFNKELRVTFLDVGQGNAALIEFPFGRKMLIDGGGFPGDSFDVGRMVIGPFLLHSKITRIHYLVLSHPQSDHMNGLRFIASHFHPGEFWYNGDMVKTPSFLELMEIIKSREIRTFLPGDLKGGRNINGARVEILHPPPTIPLARSFDAADLNNNSLVLKISYKGKALLFPGDLEYKGEKILISNAGGLLKSDILLSPHHGSRTSSSPRFLELVHPRICVISSGKGNFFGFPHKETLKRLKEIGCKTIRIDKTGAVCVEVGPQHLYIDTFLEKECLPNRTSPQAYKDLNQ